MKRMTFAIVCLLLASALGYFVDVYDLLIFSVVRNPSLASLGVPASESLTVGLRLLNWQMAGLLIGGVVCGSLADRRGRLAVLFGSILLYSVANILNANVSVLWMYEVLRFTAGVGLAGQLGAGVSIVSETLSPERRGYGTMFIAGVGLLGAVAAGIIGTHVGWRTAFLVGGVMGLLLLVLRIGLVESEAFREIQSKQVSRGSLVLLLRDPTRVLRYLRCIGVGLATYLVVGLVVTGAPEFGKALHLSQIPSAGTAVLLCYLSMSIGDVACTTLSQVSRNRRMPLILFNVIVLGGLLSLAVVPPTTRRSFYVLCCVLGFGCGFWSLVTTFAAEQFGTNLRGTVSTTVPNFIRAALIPITAVFAILRPHFGLLHATLYLGLLVALIGITSTASLPETFGKSLNFLET